MKKIVFATLAVALSTGTAFAASGNSSTDTGAATAEVVQPIVLTHTPGAALNFGKFTAGTGGTVSVSAAGTGTPGSDVAFVPGSTTAADAFTVAGEKNRTFAISTLGSSVSNGATSMNFTTAASAATGTLDNTGAAAFTVGGVLTVASGQAAGVYNGTYSATVTYN